MVMAVKRCLHFGGHTETASKQNYLLSKTFTFDNSNSHCFEQICFIALSFFGFELPRVNYSCSHFFSLASYKISFSFSWITMEFLLQNLFTVSTVENFTKTVKKQSKTVNEIFVQFSKKPPYFCTLLK